MLKLTKLLVRAVDPSSLDGERGMAREVFWKEVEKQPLHSLMVVRANEDNVALSKQIFDTVSHNVDLIKKNGNLQRKFLAFRMELNILLSAQRGPRSKLYHQISHLLDNPEFDVFEPEEKEHETR